MIRGAVVAERVLGAPQEGDTIVVHDGRVAAVTWHHQIRDLPTTEHPGMTLLPSFTDSHQHPVGYAALVSGLSLKPATSVSEVGDLLAEAASHLPAGRALMAQRLDDAPLGRLPTRHDLDAAVADRPTIAYRYCGHVAIVNTAALRLAAIDEWTPDPPGGLLDRDERGLPTGVLRETAVDLVAPHLDPLLDPPGPDRILRAMEGLLATGIDHIGAMAATSRPLWAGVGDEVAALCEIAEDVPLDVDVMVIADSVAELRVAAKRLARAGGRVRFWGWKGFADGSLGGHTAAMSVPYADGSGAGTLRLDPAQCLTMARAAVDLGGVAAVHAIGDQAVDATLGVFDTLLGEGVDPGRLRVEHASVLSDGAISRLATTGVIASVQPSFLTSEATWLPDRLGPYRPAYRFATMHGKGVRMIGGSDCPVEVPDPLVGMAAAYRRPGWDDTEHLPLDAALALYTSGPAAHFGRPTPLAVGSPADFVVVSGEPGGPPAVVEAVYSRGQARQTRPVPWPG